VSNIRVTETEGADMRLAAMNGSNALRRNTFLSFSNQLHRSAIFRSSITSHLTEQM
jgi:hypothetical protein